jgi:archaellum component FlaG (FlaF/FlaG flagellin family)
MFVLTALFLAKCFGFLNNGITSFSDLFNSNLKHSGMHQTNVRILNNP